MFFLVRYNRIILALLSIMIICILYFLFNPMEAFWMPKCFFHELTGLNCPACGNQRALHALMHAQFVKAWQFNPFLFISLPYLLPLLFIKICKVDNRYTIVRVLTHKITIYIYVIMICVWWISRNIIFK